MPSTWGRSQPSDCGIHFWKASSAFEVDNIVGVRILPWRRFCNEMRAVS